MTTQTNKPLTYHVVMLEAVKAQRAADKAGDSVGTKLVKLFKSCSPGDSQLDDFLEKCKAEEDFIRSDKAGKDKVDVIPQIWRSSKSQLKRACEDGIDLNAFDAAGAIRVAHKKLKESKTGTSAGNTGKGGKTADKGADDEIWIPAGPLQEKMAEASKLLINIETLLGAEIAVGLLENLIRDGRQLVEEHAKGETVTEVPRRKTA